MENSSLFHSVYNPDVLSCIANLSNDEVFTPPELANKIIDMLPQELFENPDTTFLDPCCKSGVFLREIAKRLLKGLERQIPDIEKRIEHIFSKQLYGIAITELTSLLSRRSVYCSKFPSSPWSAYQFPEAQPQGNIIYQRIQHTWQNGKCVHCGASQNAYDRGYEFETYAYQFIHNLDVKKLFDMNFDVIIGNPPYQLEVGIEKDNYSIALYHKFVSQAIKLNPRYLSMIIPSRWFAGGRGLDDFRDEMLHDDRLRIIHDYPEAVECFPGTQIKGGVCYFLWERDNRGLCEITTHLGGYKRPTMIRPLLEPGCSTFIRYNESISILHKVRSKTNETMAKFVSPQTPFGFVTSFKGHKEKSFNDIPIYVSGSVNYVNRMEVIKGRDLIDVYKVFIPKAGSGSDSFPHSILGMPLLGDKGSICNQTYLVIGPFFEEKHCENLISYIKTRFFRFMVMLKKNTQDAMRGVYEFVPVQDFSKPWTDEELYAKYGLTQEEIDFIESMIRPME